MSRRYYGVTKQERKSIAIAKQLTKAIARIEEYDGDPSDIFDDAAIETIHFKREVAVVLHHLREYYEWKA